MINYYKKYLKYKNKYLKLINLNKGGKQTQKEECGWCGLSGCNICEKDVGNTNNGVVYIGTNPPEELSSKYIIAKSKKIKKILEKEGDTREYKIYKPNFMTELFLDDLFAYPFGDKGVYVSRCCQPERYTNKKGKTFWTLKGWKNYPESKDLKKRTKIYAKKNGKEWGKLINRLKNNKGWNIELNGKNRIILDKNFEITWTVNKSNSDK